MRRDQISLADLQEDMRLSAKTEDLHEVKVARLEANGDISFILREKKG